MKERPILFSAPMVRAILDGSKTQTRRAVKPRHIPSVSDEARERGLEDHPTLAAAFCPYGREGDMLWCRETFQGPIWEGDFHDRPDDAHSPKYCEYAADGGPTPEFMDADDNLICRWKPSIHMPRWASRITLEIVSVRVERLQAISETDCFAEGIKIPCDENHVPLIDISSKFAPARYLTNPRSPTMSDLARAHYASLWDTINGAGSWDANPWVWVVAFRILK